MGEIEFTKMTKYIFILIGFLLFIELQAQDSSMVYKKRVLESTEIDFLSSYYTQNGENAAVSGGIGTEELSDATGTVVISIPLNADDVLTIDAGISAYTSASSSNVNPFDGKNQGDPFVASSGASKGDVWVNGVVSYSHSSDDRNTIWGANLSVAAEYDYTSIGGGASFTKLFNQKNTEFNIHGNVYIDNWSRIYPSELRGNGGDDDDRFNLNNFTITGNPDYNPKFQSLQSSGRNTYALGLGFAQILSKKLQGSLALDVVLQNGLLSTPFQRVYFSDVEDSFIENFHLADDIERMPATRFKTAIGGRLNYYLNEFVSLRSFYRFYADDWGINSHTASIEVPIKILMGKITFYPSYRFYNQTAADYFAPYNQHLSSSEFYTSDYDLSEYSSNQFGFGVSYTDILRSVHIWKIGLKSIDLKYYKYDRNTSFTSGIITLGVKFVLD